MSPRHWCVAVFLGIAPASLESCATDSTMFSPVEAAGEGGEAAGHGAGAGRGGRGGDSNAGRGGGQSAGTAGSGNTAGGDAGATQGGGGAAAGEGGEAGGASGGRGGAEAGSSAISGAGGDASGAGRAGEAGVPGAGGLASGAGGEGGGDAGAGQSGEGGADAGAGGRGSPEELKHCAYECSSDDDCASPGIIKYACDPATKRCAAPELTCAAHRDCVPFASSWTVACEKDEDCPNAADVCVDAVEAGRCARAFAEGTACPLPGQVSVPRARFGEPETVVQVCGKTHGRCAEGTCFLGCTEASECGQGDGDTCDVESGRCTCVADTECTRGVISHCNQRTGRCDECVSDFHCLLDVSRDRCVAGRCGCSSEDVCAESVFPGATPVCE